MLDRSSFEKVRMFAYRQAADNKPSVPKFLRRMLARTSIHRSWLQGHTGSFLVSIMDRS